VSTPRERDKTSSLSFVTQSKDAVLIDALVQPRASRDAIDGVHDEALKLKVKAPPVDDRANSAVEKLLAGLLELPRTNVTVVGGHSSRRKRIAISGSSREWVVDRLLRALPPTA
jgi:uncharacterized protein (TIGR00251 family)